ncbi:glycoside hydrolase family 3 C-terminal domain-containing protein [bacterium]|nr:glycoside hydrolase family 3 C-terminal domain-containing protein [bacterium]
MIEKRANEILGQMTLEEKIDYIGGDREFYIRPIERLGLPEIKMADGPIGVRNYGKATAYPASIALASTWNVDLAERFGRAIGRDSRARGVHILLAPGVNITRSPLCGRNFEYCGEDPFLAGRIATATIRGVQGEEVLATVKHLAVNNQEYERHHVSSEVDERTLREIYLPAFEAAVQDGEVACVMNAYNLLNGEHCTENNWLNNVWLKSECGFDGILMSDWVSCYDAIGCANGGLDLEMPDARYMNRENLLPAIERGLVNEATIDDKVLRILRTIIGAGFLDRPQLDESIPMDDPVSAQVALEIARQGIVLLKNQNETLPLNEKTLKKIAVIGPNAGPGVPVGGGSSHVGAFHTVSMLEGIQHRAGDAIEVVYESGNVVPNVGAMAKACAFEHEVDGSTAPGLMTEYFANMELSGEPARRDVTETLSFNWNHKAPEGLPREKFSVRWTGRIRPTESGNHWFVARADDGVRVWLDGELILDDWSDHAPRVCETFRTLEANRAYDIRIEFYQNAGGANMEFGWIPVVGERDSAAVAAAREADAVIVCAGFDWSSEGEGSDREFILPGKQDELIEHIVAANPNTIVVLNSGGAVDMTRWVDRVPAVLQAWYPGQEGGTALAQILFGDQSPSGKLPQSFERELKDNPSAPYYHSEDGRTTHYREGIFIGYRGYEANNVAPLFCFGHGLSYTSFEYSGLEIDGKRVTFTITNTGSRPGAEIAQLYVADREASVKRPPKELKGFARVELQPGESREVSIDLNDRAFAFYDVDAKDWIVEPGDFEILVGSSSQDIRAKGTLTIQ